MSDKLKKAFDSIHADEELKEKTRQYLRTKTNDYQTERRKTGHFYRLVPVMAGLFLIVLGFSGYQIYTTPTSVISIDVNPSLELGVNRFDKVVSVEGYNKDGKILADSVDVKYENYKSAVDEIINTDTIQKCLAENELLSITVIGDNEDQKGKILSDMEQCTSGNENMSCHASNSEDVHEAHDHGISYGKYQAYLELKKLDPEITLDEVKGMTMREIQNLIQSFSGNQTGNGQGNGNQTENSNALKNDSTDCEEEKNGHQNHGEGTDMYSQEETGTGNRYGHEGEKEHGNTNAHNRKEN